MPSHWSAKINAPREINNRSLFEERKNEMQITDVKIRKTFEEGPMRAVVSVTFDDQFAVHDIKVIYAGDKYFIVMPSRKKSDGTFRDIAHPINADFREEIEKTVLDAYFDALAAQKVAIEETLNNI